MPLPAKQLADQSSKWVRLGSRFQTPKEQPEARMGVQAPHTEETRPLWAWGLCGEEREGRGLSSQSPGGEEAEAWGQGLVKVSTMLPSQGRGLG